MSKSTENINERQLDRLDDRYVTTKESITALAALVSLIIPGIVWVFFTISDMKTEITLLNEKLNTKTEMDAKILENITNSNKNLDEINKKLDKQ